MQGPCSPGEYSLKISGGAQPPERFQVNRDPQESDFTALSPTSNIASLRDTGGIVFGPKPLSEIRAEARRRAAHGRWRPGSSPACSPSWSGEAAYAFWLDRQRRSSGPGAPMAPAFHV